MVNHGEDTPRVRHTYTLSCIILGFTVPNTAYQWSKNSTVLTRRDPNLSLPTLQLSDAGVYTCTVMVGSRSDRNTTSITIQSV